jgi:hypothetical protein
VLLLTKAERDEEGWTNIVCDTNVKDVVEKNVTDSCRDVKDGSRPNGSWCATKSEWKARINSTEKIEDNDAKDYSPDSVYFNERKLCKKCPATPEERGAFEATWLEKLPAVFGKPHGSIEHTHTPCKWVDEETTN